MLQKKKIFMAIVLVLVIVALAGCVDMPTGKVVDNKEDIKIGIFAALTGSAASWGQNALAGATLAANEINEQGGVDGRKIVLVIEDDKCSAESVNAVTKLITIDDVDALIGPVCSTAAEPSLPVAKKFNIPTIIPTASAPGLTKIGNNIFRVYPSDDMQGKIAADFIIDDLEKKILHYYILRMLGG